MFSHNSLNLFGVGQNFDPVSGKECYLIWARVGSNVWAQAAWEIKLLIVIFVRKKAYLFSSSVYRVITTLLDFMSHQSV